jgi:uncharacterized protein YjbI with pentapeptide repeats
LNGANLDGADLRGAVMDGAELYQTNVANVLMRRDAVTPSQLAQAVGTADIQWLDELGSREPKR